MRWIPAALLVAVVATAAWLVLRDDAYRYRVVFENAGQLVTGDVVRIGGTEVGTVEELRLTPDNRAEVVVSVSQDYAPLHDGTTAVIRQQSLTGVTSRYVSLSPASETRRALEDGAAIGADDTTTIVDVDQLFDTLDPPTRQGLKRLIRGSASWYDGQTANANASAELFPVALQQMRLLAGEINADSETFERLVVQTAAGLRPLARRGAQVTQLVSDARATAQALGGDTAALNATLAEVPPMLRAGSEALADLRPAIADLRRLTDVAGPATRDLAPFLRELRPVTDEAVPTFASLRRILSQPGAANDALDALADLPPLARHIERGFPRGRRALRESTPVLAFARPYTPELVGWARSFGSTTATYDANGHYARTSANFDAFTFVDDPEGGHFEPKAPAERGRSPYLTNGNLRRCPGSAAIPPADASAPFVDDGPLANPDCDPSQRPGGAP